MGETTCTCTYIIILAYTCMSTDINSLWNVELTHVDAISYQLYVHVCAALFMARPLGVGPRSGHAGHLLGYLAGMCGISLLCSALGGTPPGRWSQFTGPSPAHTSHFKGGMSRLATLASANLTLNPPVDSEYVVA